MAAENATILISDISGFTEFVTKTELHHGNMAINMLLETILQAVGDYEVAEIEGDAVLLYKKGHVPIKKDILATCMNIFHAFHSRRIWMQEHRLCPCNACQALEGLTLKFVAHHGPVAEIKVGRFVKPSGPDMIVAHRLLKNSIGSNEYVLLTEKAWRQDADEPDLPEIWESSSDEFASIGRIDYRFTRLDSARNEEATLPDSDIDPPDDNESYHEVFIAADYRDVYMVVMNIAGRASWIPGLQHVEQDTPHVIVGSIHHCRFEHYVAVVSPLFLKVLDGRILYREKHHFLEIDMNLVYEYVFKKTDDKNCVFGARFILPENQSVPEDVCGSLITDLVGFAEQLKAYAEAMDESLFESGTV